MRNRTLVPEQSGPVAPLCWQREAPSPCLRVELADDEIHLLAYQHFVSAALTRGSNGNETLLVMFSTHELAIDGQGLRELLLCLQDYAVKWLRALPKRYQSLAPSADGIIHTIRISVPE
jgi:hypothetical protein